MARRPPAPARPRGAPSSAARGRGTTTSGARPAARPGARPPSHRPAPAPGRAAADRSEVPSASAARAEQVAGDGGEPRPVRLARWLSVRGMVLGLVLLVAFALLFPSVQAYLGQRAELNALAAQATASEEAVVELRAELDRWDDPAYVQAQARERLLYVMPGETPYRVIDPEVVVEQPPVDGVTDEGIGATLPFGGPAAPWYATVWESVALAGAYGYLPEEVPDEDAPAGPDDETEGGPADTDQEEAG